MNRDRKLTTCLCLVAMNSESYVRKTRPVLKCLPRFWYCAIPKLSTAVERCGENVHGRPTRCARLQRKSAKLHSFGQVRGRLSSAPS